MSRMLQEVRPALRTIAVPLRWALLGVVWVSLATTGCGGGGSDNANKPGGGPGGIVAPVPTGAHFMLAPEQAHYGATFAQWSQRWWQWVFETPRAGHPLYDTTGADALTGQVDPVWFLGGVFTAFNVPKVETVVRDISIPRGIALFFPVINVVADNTNCASPDFTYTFTQLRQFNATAMASAQNLLCEIDGARVIDSPNLAGAQRFRASAPAFSAWQTDDNIWYDFCGGVTLPGRVVTPIASDGIWMMVGPMPAGAHTIHFSGALPYYNFQLDITYNITVLP